ncbi:ATP-binding protein [Nitrosophilus alvini]|uniref:ATP-binding protein n=1 Tax=Nitrosophilus alvini TaxID=2714855 RepID=UPI00190DFAF9|nr:ATP-binding protein [Nitrosophilus alvini]
MNINRLLSAIDNKTKNFFHIKQTDETKKLMSLYNLNLKETAIFLVVLKHLLGNSRYTCLENLLESKKVDYGTKEHLEVLKVLRSLEKKDLIILEKSGRRNISNPEIKIDEDVFNELVLKDNDFSEVDFSDNYKIIDYVHSLYNKRHEENISQKKFFRRVEEISKKIKDDYFRSILCPYSTIEKVVVFKTIIEKVLGDNGGYATDLAEEIFDNLSEIAGFMEKIYAEDLKIIENKIVRVEEEGKFRNDPRLEIEEKVFYRLFKVKKRVKREFASNVVKYLSYKKIDQDIYLDKEIKTQIDLIAKTIDKKNFDSITKKLRNAKLSSGIVALFYGFPGTGKTATAYYLAKKSQRDILQVDISNIRDKYVGESEKRLKAIFKEYERAKEELKTTPILLFNEADALIGQRLNTRDSVDVMNNAMQNILLEELEKFDGIFIATTNLIENMDEAFNRRFLYKIEYKKPSKQVRKMIWLKRAPQIKVFIDEIADFELTGGQIENIAKKVLLDSILNQKEITLNILESLIKDEIGFKNDKIRKIGIL